MNREIDLVIDATVNGFLAVEEDSNRLWNHEDLLEAREQRGFAGEDRVDAISLGQTDVTTVYPGCLQQGAASDYYSEFVPVGRTKHFILFGHQKGKMR